MRGCGEFVLAAGFLASVLWGQTGAPTPVVTERQVGKLELGVPVDRELGPGLADVFTVEVRAGQFAHVVAEQKGVDVVVTVTGPDGKVIVTADSPNDTLGPEPTSWIADGSGVFRVRVSKSDRSAESGKYQVQLTDLREPTEADGRRIEAELSFFAAVVADRTDDKERRNQAIKGYERAASLWHELKEGYGEAICLHRIGRAYSAIGAKQKAMDYYQRALLLRRAVGDRAGEANTLIGIGIVYSALGEKQKALDYYGQALPIERAVGDRSGEAGTLNNVGLVYSELGEKQKALDYYGQALPLMRAVGDRSGEAGTLINIGIVYSDFGEKQKALDYYGQALPIERAVGDRAGEAATLGNIGNVYADLGEKQKALEYYGQALPLMRAVGDRAGEAGTLINIGIVYADLGEKQKALDYYGQALPLTRAVGDRTGEAKTLIGLGAVYRDLGEKQKALDYYGQALPIERAVGDRAGEAITLHNIGEVYSDLGEKQKALDYYGQALPIERAVGDRSGEAGTLIGIGNVYSDLGEKQKALDYYGQALPIERAVGDRSGEAGTLIGIGNVYSALGEKQKALDYYGQALPIERAVGDRSGEAGTLIGIGNVYSALGEKQKALDYYGQALPLKRAVGDRAGEANTLIGIGIVYSDLGEKQKALDYYGQALLLRRAVEDRAGEAGTLIGIGNVYSALGEKQKALDYYGQALPLKRAVGDRAGEANTLNNIGVEYSALGEKQKALDYYGQALPIERAVGDRAGEAATLNNIALVFQYLAQPGAAIWFAKQAVNVLQSIRRDNEKLSDELKHSYEKSIEPTYRRLASLLVDRERFAEAEEVLNLLKEKEASDYVRDSVADVLRPATLLESEKKDLAVYEENLGKLVTLGQQLAALQTKKDKNKGTLEAADAQEEARLNTQLDAANGVFERFIKEVGKPLAGNTAAAKSVDKVSDESLGMQEKLQHLGPGVVAIYTLVLPDKYVAILVTSGTRKAYSTTIKETDLDHKIFEFRRQLEISGSNPLPLAQELYHVVFPEGLRQDLDSLPAHTIMWSIDSTLRYVPLAALHDGHGYLVNTFTSSLITPAFLDHLDDAPTGVWKGTGFGVSETKDTAHFSELPSVKLELQGIFRQNEQESGPVAGRYLLNTDFTREAFLGLRGKGNDVVHIATHFDSQPGEAKNSKLLLGDGVISLDDINRTTGLFRNVDLLTLSACSTAYTDKAGEDGREVDSFGTIAQHLGAKGVIASLWSVSDEATARLMERMYRLRQENPGAGKGEALRRAQAEMAGGVMKAGDGGAADRAAIPRPAGSARAKDWTHPYYWAPFILIGNWK